jgi:pseudaminic acid synthase
LNIEGVEVGQGQPCRTVAEVSNAHNGSFNRAIRIIDAAKEAGADFIKFQCYTPDELVALRGDGPAPEPWGSQGWTMGALYEKARTPLEWFSELFAHARAIGIVPFSSVFGPESLAALQAVDCPAYKIAALDNVHLSLVANARASGKPVIVSVRKNEWAVDGVSRLLCPPGYPQTVDAVDLPDDFAASGYLGYSYHGTRPSDPLMAVARGAKLIEAHFQLDDEPSELEANVSLYASHFNIMVRLIPFVEQEALV